MPSPTRLLALASLLLAASAIVPPGKQGDLNQPADDTPAPTPDNDAIADTAGQVNQKSAVPVTAAPSDNVPATTVTAVDGDLVNSTVASVADSSRRRKRQTSQPGEYIEVFAPKAAGVHDASIEGTAYLTYTVVNNATYNVDGCEFVNLYYEFNNELLDFVFSEKSNLKYQFRRTGVIPSGPSVGDEPVPLTYITQSSGWAAKDLTDPPTPEGYDLVFGPTGGANNAPGYMGFAFLDRYDPEACATLCNGRGYDPVGGVCQYFNIWRAVVDGYYLVADESTAVNFGQGDLVVTLSRGYARKSVVVDGGFEGFTECDDFCFEPSYTNWVGTSQAGGDEDATIFFFPPYAHTGHGSGLLGAAFGDDSDSGTLTPAQPLKTEDGKNYVVQVFVSNAFSGEQLEAPAAVNVLWNNKVVGTVKGFQQYTPEQFNVVGTGSDVLAFQGGAAPAWTFLDDVFVALL
ncbi:hypothetical protein FB45DRAFT_922306 [Roridomyces roridus]|uniref:Uncharacterized protein n=1 Tax=Roridomyces roridus TaxID=1738132 RepID=A0AAD7BMW6_9AGAR|nr:hypothetical protein FB45DRAFT_922306 [Roridomyces roridus]